MPALAKVDTSRLQRKLGALLVVVGGDARRVLRTEMAHLIEDLAGATTKPNRQEKRIKRDFGVAFRPARGGAATPDMQELYKTLDSYGRHGRKLPTAAVAFYAERYRHQQRIGFLAAGWLGGGNPMRAKVPAVISRQPVHGSFAIDETPTHYILTATNRVGFARHMRGLVIIIQKAVNRRTASIKRNMALVQTGVKNYQYRG
jgi:hypothetical protein